MRDVFLSYSQHDSNEARKIKQDLEDHGLDVWAYEFDLEIGDPVHRAIEAGIRNSRYFCFALSPDALTSYYIREVEFEQAFDKSVREQRLFILPVSVKHLGTAVADIPERVKYLWRLDLSDTKTFSENIRKIASKIRGKDDRFTGARWFKGLNISNFGEPVGAGPTSQMSTVESSYHLHWRDGRVERVDVFKNGKLVNYKEFEFDSKGRVVVNKMFTPTAKGGWVLEEDVWYYSYDQATGSRSTKTMRYPGERTARVVHYDADGFATRMDIETDGGTEPDRVFSFAYKTFDRTPDGLVTERWFDANGVDLVIDPADEVGSPILKQ